MRITRLLTAAFALTVTPATGEPSPYLLMFAGDADEKEDDFFAVIDVRSGSPTNGKVIATLPIGMKASMPHHMEYVLPGSGRLLHANAHHHEATFLLDTSNPLQPKIVETIVPPAPLRFPHDFARLPNGRILAGFLRSEGVSPRSDDKLVPGGHGGLAEYDGTGKLLRQVSAAVAGATDPIRPYAIVPMLNIDRIVTTSAPMMEEHSADVVQVWRYSDLKLLHTVPVPAGKRPDGSALPGAARFPFGPRLLGDGSILMNSYGCGFYRLTDIASAQPKLTNVYTIDVPDPKSDQGVRGACSIPVIKGRHWIMPVGRAQTIVVLDISDPAKPKEVSRLDTRKDFNPHWSALDPSSDRVVVGAELGGEQGMYVLRFDAASGKLAFDPSMKSESGEVGYIDLTKQVWPHGATGAAWAHAALFLPERR